MKDEHFIMDVAKRRAMDSHAVRAKVGAVVVSSTGDIISTAYNGTIRGFHTNTCEYRDYTLSGTGKIYTDESTGAVYRLVTDEDITIHAERNLISHAARRGISIMGGSVYITLSPCMNCTSLMIQCGITEIVYDEKYRNFDQVEETYGRYIRMRQYSPKPVV